MPNSDWTKRTYTFSALREWAEDFAHLDNTVAWLKAMGVIPSDVTHVKPKQVKLELDPKAIEGGYLAAVAYEWDSWGPSSPLDLVAALRCELKGAPERDIIAGILTMLGKATTTEDTDVLAAA